MHVTKGKAFFLLIAVSIYFGWENLSRTTYETAVLHIPTVGNQDTYVSLWLVEDIRYVWIRAESPRRRWLDYLRDEPIVELQRNGHSVSYRAKVYDRDDARALIDPMFRAKYGLADEVRALMTPRTTVPIQLRRP